ncbi:MAG: arginine repressor [Actinobacteria bacterium]|nr:arginine repressor [Actinomycetota bacterium]
MRSRLWPLRLPSIQAVRRFIVAKRVTLSSNARRALVVNFVNQGLVRSQSDLVDLLADEGIEVTQATASRDLDDVGAVRGKDASGVMRYQFLESSVEPLARMARVSDQLLLSVTASGNIVVIKTPPGGAQLLASALDRASESSALPNAIGTIAGDDTVLVISRNASGGKLLAAQLRDFIATELSGSTRKTGKSKKVRR